MGGNKNNYISTHDAARLLGYTLQHTRLLIRQDKLAAEKFGRDWLVLRESVAEYETACLWPAEKEVSVEKKPIRRIVNVASVPMRSPFRYPGGKTWLVPTVRRWLQSRKGKVKRLIEPFAGGAIIGLTAVFDLLVGTVTLSEIDEDVSAVWQVVLNGQGRHLADMIVAFKMSQRNVETALADADKSQLHHAFATIVRNRINRGGILAPGAGVVKNGENGKGLSSRWYPETLRRRILDICALKSRIHFVGQDGIQVLMAHARRKDVAFFIDPPYTVAGRRLYAHSEIDHARLFAVTSTLAGDFLMTYDDTKEIRGLALQHGFETASIAMKNTHHARKTELLIGRNLNWLE